MTARCLLILTWLAVALPASAETLDIVVADVVLIDRGAMLPERFPGQLIGPS